MNQTTPLIPDLQNTTEGFRTMADLLDLVRNDPLLTDAQRRTWSSAIRRLCEMLEIRLETSPTSLPFLRRKLKGFHPRQAESRRSQVRARGSISPKTFQNIRSAVLTAVSHYADSLAPPRKIPLSDEWQALRDSLTKKEMRFGMSRLIRYCSANSIAPNEVTDAVADRVLDWLVNGSLVDNPERVQRRCLVNWNKAVDTVPGWPPQRLTVPDRRNGYTLAWDDLPDGIRADTEAWLSASSGNDPFCCKGPPRPYSEKTVESYRFRLRQLVSALHRQGYNIEQLGSLRNLVDPDTAELALRFFYERAEQKPSSQTAGLSALLCTIAQHWCGIDGQPLARLKGFRNGLSDPHQGLAPENRRRLLQFTDDGNIETLLTLPQVIAERLKHRKQPGRREVSLMEIALMVEILLMMPVRRNNIVTLRLDRHILDTGKGANRQVTVMIPASEVKNAKDLCFPLPAAAVTLLDLYCGTYRPMLVKDDDNPWLFPGQKPGAHRNLDQVSRSFSKIIKRETGLALNMHLMRHFGAKLYLDRNPGQYEVMRRVLAHRRLSTTTNNYTGLEAEAAYRHYDAVILGIRDAIKKEISND